MPSTFTSALSLEKQATGENSNTWGVNLNAVLDDIDDAVADRLTKSVAGGSDVTLTAAEALHSTHEYTGTLTGNIAVIVPASNKIYFVYNNTAGSFTLTVKTSAGSGVVVAQGSTAIVVCDGTNVVNWDTISAGAAVILDADGDTTITADTDDRIDFALGGTDLFRFDGTAASSVNGLDFVAASTGNPVEIQATGDANADIKVVTKGTGDFLLFADALELLKVVQVASAINFPQLEPSAAGNPIVLAGFGDDTDVGIKMQPKGDGATELASGALNEAKGSDIASATTTDIGAATGNLLTVTGTTTITGLGTVQAGTRRIVHFAAALTLTHNATSLILPGGTNITTAADDVAIFVSLGAGNWRCVNYMRADGGQRGWEYGAQTATTSGTAVALSTAIPDWATEIEVIFRAVATDTTGQPPIIQLGHTAGTYITTGYLSIVVDIGSATAAATEVTDGIWIVRTTNYTANDPINTVVRLTRWDPSEDIWQAECIGYEPTTFVMGLGQSEVDVTAALDSIRLTTTGGAATFNAGEARVRWR